MTNMNFENLIVKREGKVATITLNRPEKLNAITSKMLQEIIRIITEVDKDDSISVLIITGAGRAFSAGLDLKDMATLSNLKDAEEVRVFHQRNTKAISMSLQNMEKPTIAMVNGLAIAVSCDLALTCDIRTGSENARFAETQVNFGGVPGLGGTWVLPRLVGYGRAAEIIWTADFIDAEEAYRIGILNHLFPAAKLEEKTMELAQRIASKPAIGLKLTKLNLRRGLEANLETAISLVNMSQGISATSSEHARIITEKQQQIKKEKEA
ncbi:enoyl-CoA hydratase/isomerase family protein [Chloroflexota bacterium]